MIGRREFLRKTLIGAGTIALSRYAGFAAPATSSALDSRVEVLLGEQLGTISPNIYGHFTENLGGVIYDGVWVGKSSKVPNLEGIRRDLVEHMRKIKAPVVRYPGGCFADSYDWCDGIGPGTNARGEQISGLATKPGHRPPVTSMIRMNSAPTNSCISVN